MKPEHTRERVDLRGQVKQFLGTPRSSIDDGGRVPLGSAMTTDSDRNLQMRRVRQEYLPFVGSSHEFIGGTQRRDWNCEFNLLESVGSKGPQCGAL